MSVTRRGFLGICGAAVAGAVIPGKKEPTAKTATGDYHLTCTRYVRPHTYSYRIRTLSPQENSFLAELERTGMRHEKPAFADLGKIFSDEIQATMERPGFCDRLFKDAYTPIKKEELLHSGKVAVLTDFRITECSAVDAEWADTTYKVEPV